MKAGWMRRLGMNLVVLAVVAPVIYLIVAGKGKLQLSDAAMSWFSAFTGIAIAVLLIGVLLMILGRARTAPMLKPD
jgi:hypothetical protein